jgi:hypothetical protein
VTDLYNCFKFRRGWRMGKHHKSKSPFTPKTNSPDIYQRITELNFEFQKLQAAVNDLVGQVNRELAAFKNQIQQNFANINQDTNNCLDWIEAVVQADKNKAFTQKKFFDFCQEKMSIPFVEMDMDIKLNALLQYLEITSNISDSQYLNYTYAAFDRRHNLVALNENEVPTNGDIAFMTWRFDVAGVPVTGQNRLSVYKIGSNELTIDNEILKMKIGETKTFDVTFPADHRSEVLRGKQGKLTIGLARFKRQVLTPQQIQQQLKNIPQDKKKDIWKQAYRPETIE